MQIDNQCATSRTGKRCLDLERLVRWVYAQIPPADQRHIEAVCRVVRIARGGFSGKGIGNFAPEEATIRFIGPTLVEDHVEDGQIGLIAHEFAHACDFARRGLVDEEDAERVANTILKRWGFEEEYRTTQEEHPSVFGTIGLDD